MDKETTRKGENNMSFFDKEPHQITQEQYNGYQRSPNKDRFRCYICGHWFRVDDFFEPFLLEKVSLTVMVKNTE